MVERIPSGVPGLDRLIEGGIPKGFAVLLTGGTGTGKTILSTQFLLEGLKRGERVVFISLEEESDDIKEDVKSFGWNLNSYEKKGLCKIIYYDPFEIGDIEAAMTELLEDFKPDRLVLDSISVVGLYLKEPAKVRKKVMQIIKIIKRFGCTSILTSEILEDNHLSRFDVEEFISDGVIVLHFTGIGGQSFGNIQIRKMRRTEHERGWFPTEITKNGIEVGKEETSGLLK